MADPPQSEVDRNRLPTDEDLDRLQWTTILYYLHETNPDNGLVRDKTDPSAPCSIAALGMALATAPGRRRAWRAFPARSRPSWHCGGFGSCTSFPRDPNRTRPGTRASSITFSTSSPAAAFGSASCPRLTRRSCSRACSPPRRISTTTRPTRPRSAAWPMRFIDGPTGTGRGTAARRSRTAGGRKAASSRTAGRATTRGCCCTCWAWARPPTRCRRRATPPFARRTSGKQLYGRELLYSGPLFTHQLSHLWIDFRGLQDAFMRDHGSDYFENSRQATFVQQAYAIHNPLQFAGYGEHCWGFTACDGPGWMKRVVDGVERQFFDYYARGAPFGPDDGTVAPWVVVASLPFAPEIVIPTVRHLADLKLGGHARRYGFERSFNQTFRVDDSPTGWWVSPYYFGIDQGPVALMIENYRTGLIWDITRRCPYFVDGTAAGGVHRRLAVGCKDALIRQIPLTTIHA